MPTKPQGVAVEHMQKRQPDLVWQQADAINLLDVFPPSSFDICIDKGVSDSVQMRSKKKDRLKHLHNMFTGITTLLKPSGSFLNFSCRRYVRHKMKGYDWEVKTVEIPVNTDRLLHSVHQCKIDALPDRCAYVPCIASHRFHFCCRK